MANKCMDNLGIIPFSNLDRDLLELVNWAFDSSFQYTHKILSFRIRKQNGAIFNTEIAFKISQNACYDIIIIYLSLSL